MVRRKYINHNSKGELLEAYGKADALIADGAEEVAEGVAAATPPGRITDLVAVVEHGTHDAALHVACRETLHMIFDCKRQGDRRRIRWLMYSHASELAGREYVEAFYRRAAERAALA